MLQKNFVNLVGVLHIGILLSSILCLMMHVLFVPYVNRHPVWSAWHCSQFSLYSQYKFVFILYDNMSSVFLNGSYTAYDTNLTYKMGKL
jgi:hypothetical protein